MKIFALLIACALLSGCNDTPGTKGTPTLEELRGQWVVVNYWAKWCKPCIREIPELNALNRQYQQVTVVGVNFDGVTAEQLAEQILELDIQFPMLKDDPAQSLGVSRPVVLPTTFILNPAGVISQTLVGPQTLETLALATGQSQRSEAHLR